ncbi:hypothetical protein Syun_006193 [Stephania yunnanensis]|uniref:AMP-dependent synthetase/ligase domain-containing protein n=1 Tax=Stephania yunnanensis TaxID=152371 RepID=A0AAP0KW49_9MAGN
MAMLSLRCELACVAVDRRSVLEFRRSLRRGEIVRGRCRGGQGSRPRIRCCKSSVELQLRKYSPLLESSLLSNDNALQSGEWTTVPDIWRSSAEKYGDRTALVDPYHEPPSKLTYKQILEDQSLHIFVGSLEMLQSLHGKLWSRLRVIGVKPEEKVALFADNSSRWLVADQGIMATGAINVVRGTRSSVEELLQIYNHSESVALIVDNPDSFKKISATFISKAVIRFAVLLWGEKSSLDSAGTENTAIFDYREIIDLGRDSRRALSDSHEKDKNYTYEPICSDDVATLVYTSGTTGIPKGVMLTHRNLLHQIKNLWDIVPAEAGDRFLSMLPPWHAYERACEYFTFTYGVEQVYTTIKNLKEDLHRYQPHYLISVPLVYETLYRIQTLLNFKASLVVEASTGSDAVQVYKAAFGAEELKREMHTKKKAEQELPLIPKAELKGKFLTKNPKQHSMLVSVVDWVWARVIAAVLWPLHLLGKKLIYGKIHSAIGISKAIGVKLQNGYGLTESSPVVAARLPYCNVLGSVGHPLPYTNIQVVDAETAKVLPAGSKGIVKVKGPQVMKGYYKNPSATKQVLDDEGWLNTGDIGWIAPHHSLGRSRHCGGIIVLEGRAKDTIVLMTGENVEPSVLEEAAVRSKLIHQIVVIGQIESGLMTPTMKIRRDKVVALYSDQIARLFGK